MDSFRNVRLGAAPGDGTLSRTATKLLYVPAPGNAAALLDAFESDGDVQRAVGDAVVDSEFTVPPFALVDWTDGITLMAFGDVEVRTDQPALPMLSGAASESWVEHRLRHRGDSVNVTVTGGSDDWTNLRDGVVFAGGFTLELSGADVADGSAGELESKEVSDSQAGSLDPPASGLLEVGTRGSHESLLLNPEPEVPPKGSLSLVQNSESSDASLQPSECDDSPDAPSEVVSVDGSMSAFDPDATVLPNHGAALGGTDGVLVEAKVCAEGHVNPPSSSTCRSCGELFAPGGEGVLPVSRPPLGQLTFDDGQVIILDRGCVLGRSPNTVEYEDSTAIPLDGEKMSRQHAAVILEGWNVLVSDLGSTNGTIVVPAQGMSPVEVEPGIPLRLDDGATVFLGSRSFRYQVGVDLQAPKDR